MSIHVHMRSCRDVSTLLKIILLLSSALFLTSYNVPEVAALTIRVPTNYPTIQAAINAASPGDTILVSSGTYIERILVNKYVKIMGENPQTTIIDGSKAGVVVNITASYVQITNFTVRNGGYYHGIWVETPPGGTILGVLIDKNIFLNNYAGVILVRSVGAIISNNLMQNNQYGIRSSASSRSTIRGNRIESSVFYGMHLYSRSTNNTIDANILVNNKYGIHLEWSNFNNVSRNTITSAPAKNGYGIRLTSTNYTRISANTMELNYYGIVLWQNSAKNLIYLNNFMNNTVQAYHYDTPLGANIWDTDVRPGTKGNYWSDYTGVDNGSGVGRWGEARVAGDGIGDTLIPHQSVDYYPLMVPWSPWPIARFTFSPDPPYPMETVTFDARKSSGDLVSYKWDFGDGTAPPPPEPDPITYHVFATPGNYTVTLTVTDREGLYNSTSKLVTVLPFRLVLDVYTQKEPYSGRGINQSSDAFEPQEQVDLIAYLTYNDNPVKDKLVAFYVKDPDDIIILSRSDTTDENGLANVSFTLANNATFGIYTVTSSAEVAGSIATDTLSFQVGWIIEIIRVETVDQYGNPKSDFRRGEYVYFNIIVQNIAFITKNVTLSITLYDETKTPIGALDLKLKVDPGWFELNLVFSMIIPKWSYVGVATAYASAFTDWPWARGRPYCPEATAAFLISR